MFDALTRAVAGMWFTLLIPETKGKSLEELNGEDALPTFGGYDASSAEVALTLALPEAMQRAPPPASA